MRRSLLLAIAVLMAFGALTVPPALAGDTVPAGALVIAPNGNDSNPCTASAPCASFQKALTSGQTFVARGGTYTRDESFSVVDGSRLLEYPGEAAVLRELTAALAHGANRRSRPARYATARGRCWRTS